VAGTPGITWILGTEIRSNGFCVIEKPLYQQKGRPNRTGVTPVPILRLDVSHSPKFPGEIRIRARSGRWCRHVSARGGY
jgi:hypothetical protein